MDQLCHRITASMQFQPQHNGSIFDARSPSDSSIRSSFVSARPPDPIGIYDLPPSPPASMGSPQQTIYERAFPQRTLTVRSPNEPTGLVRRYNAPRESSLGWVSSQFGQHNRNPPSPQVGQEQQGHRRTDDWELDRSDQSSIQNSALGSFAGSVRLHATSTTSSTTSRYPLNFEKTLENSQMNAASSDRELVIVPERQEQPNEGRENGEEVITIIVPPTTEPPTTEPSTTEPPTTESLPLCHSRIETAEDLQRAFQAPEVVMSAESDPSSEKFLAFRTQADYEEQLLSLPAGMENIWLPLSRPAMHNRYQGFCKGAWQIRKAVR
jgi:hypothetical protein